MAGRGLLTLAVLLLGPASAPRLGDVACFRFAVAENDRLIAEPGVCLRAAQTGSIDVAGQLQMALTGEPDGWGRWRLELDVRSGNAAMQSRLHVVTGETSHFRFVSGTVPRGLKVSVTRTSLPAALSRT